MREIEVQIRIGIVVAKHLGTGFMQKFKDRATHIGPDPSPSLMSYSPY